MAASYPEPGSVYSAPLIEALSKAAVERSISIPFRIDADGFVATVEGRGNIVRQEILTLLLTTIGERVMLPRYGSNLYNHLFDNTSYPVIDAILGEISELVSDNFTGVVVTLLSVDQTSLEDGELVIRLGYSYQDAPEIIDVNVTRLLNDNQEI